MPTQTQPGVNFYSPQEMGPSYPQGLYEYTAQGTYYAPHIDAWLMNGQWIPSTQMGAYQQPQFPVMYPGGNMGGYPGYPQQPLGGAYPPGYDPNALGVNYGTPDTFIGPPVAGQDYIAQTAAARGATSRVITPGGIGGPGGRGQIQTRQAPAYRANAFGAMALLACLL